MRILVIFGTRPEAIKLCPLVLALRTHSQLEVKVCVTAQHRLLLDQVLEAFDVRPDYDLDLMRPRQSLFESTSRILIGLEPVLATEQPALVIVQGDTTTTFCGALAAFYRKIPVAHVEAGLRTGDMRQPFPEEMNRVLAARLAALHFAATERARRNLVHEGIAPASIEVTGNTAIDALFYVCYGLEQGTLQGGDWPFLAPGKKLILVTTHRRESFGGPMEAICTALARLAERSDVQIVFPVHPNPHVQEPVRGSLQELDNVHLLEPLAYVPFVDLMRRAYLLLTDSGGIQEEGPSLGKPVLVMREKTERPEAVEAGTVRLVGANPQRILEEACLLLDNEEEHRIRSRMHNPYGDGQACGRIVRRIVSELGPR